MNALEAMLKQYEQNSSNKNNNNSENKFDLKNYFNTFLKDKETTATKTIRILPTRDGSTPFVEMWGHKFQVDGEWKTYPCLKHEKDSACPFCEAKELLLSTGKETDKETAKKYSARKMYIVKVIDRDAEHEGVKFWRFNHDYSKKGIYDKIYGIISAIKKDITDKNTGRDLVLTITRDQNNKPVVSSIASLDSTPLHENEELVNQWISDERTWEDVYSVKPYECLEILVKGGNPIWDKELKKYVDKNGVVSTVNDMLNKSESASYEEPIIIGSETKEETSESTTEDDDELPF